MRKSQYGLTEKSKVLDRLDAARRFMESHHSRAKSSAARYLGSGVINERRGEGSTGDRAYDLESGQVNYAAINIRQKIAALALLNPDWVVQAADPAKGELVHEALKRDCYLLNLPRIGRRCWLMRFTASQGYVRCLWDEDGFGLEFVHPTDVYFDPHVTDETWNAPRYAAARVWMPQDDAIQRYGADALGLNLDEEKGDDYCDDTKGLGVWIYWDRTTEAEVLDGEGRGGSDGRGTVLKVRENLYGCVPLVVLQGEPAPDTEFSLSDYQTSLGAITMMADLQRIVQAHARNGGGTAWVRSEYLADEDQREKYMSGELTQPLDVGGVPGQEVVGFTPHGTLNPTVMDALSYMSGGLDADQAVSGIDRGVMTQQPKHAAESMLMAQRGTARAAQERAEYERFLERIAGMWLRFSLKFGLDPRRGEPTADDVALYEAMQSVREIRVVEESTAYKNPEAEKQAAIQMLGTAIQAFEPSLLVGKPLNIWAFVEDVLRASGKRDLSRYLLDPEEAQAVQEQVEARTQGKAGAAPQKGPRTPEETLTYDKAPEDVKRQIEARAGLQPSQEPVTGEQQFELAKQDDQQAHEAELARLKMQADAEKQDREQRQQAALTGMQMDHEQASEEQRQAGAAVQQEAQLRHDETKTKATLDAQRAIARQRGASRPSGGRSGAKNTRRR